MSKIHLGAIVNKNKNGLKPKEGSGYKSGKWSIGGKLKEGVRKGEKIQRLTRAKKGVRHWKSTDLLLKERAQILKRKETTKENGEE